MSSVIFFLIFIPILGLILLNLNFFLAPHRPYKEKKTPFECGYHSFVTQNRTQFTISFFIFALLFLLFDIEISTIFPVVVSSYLIEAYGIYVVFIFVFILTFGFVFELGKNALKIDTKQDLFYLESNINFSLSYILIDEIIQLDFFNSVLNLFIAILLGTYILQKKRKRKINSKNNFLTAQSAFIILIFKHPALIFQAIYNNWKITAPFIGLVFFTWNVELTIFYRLMDSLLIPFALVMLLCIKVMVSSLLLRILVGNYKNNYIFNKNDEIYYSLISLLFSLAVLLLMFILCNTLLNPICLGKMLGISYLAGLMPATLGGSQDIENIVRLKPKIANAVFSETHNPTENPTAEPLQAPTGQATQAPTGQVTQVPTGQVTQVPTAHLAQAPTAHLAQAPTGQVIQTPTGQMIATRDGRLIQAAIPPHGEFTDSASLTTGLPNDLASRTAQRAERSLTSQTSRSSSTHGTTMDQNAGGGTTLDTTTAQNAPAGGEDVPTALQLATYRSVLRSVDGVNGLLANAQADTSPIIPFGPHIDGWTNRFLYPPHISVGPHNEKWLDLMKRLHASTVNSEGSFYLTHPTHNIATMKFVFSRFHIDKADKLSPAGVHVNLHVYGTPTKPILNLPFDFWENRTGKPGYYVFSDSTIKVDLSGRLEIILCDANPRTFAILYMRLYDAGLRTLNPNCFIDHSQRDWMSNYLKENNISTSSLSHFKITVDMCNKLFETF